MADELMAQDTEEPTELVTRETIYSALRQALDPVYNVSVVDLGLIAGMEISAEQVIVDLYVPYDDTYSRDLLFQNVGQALQNIPYFPGGGIRPLLEEVWDSSLMSPLARRLLGLAV